MMIFMIGCKNKTRCDHTPMGPLSTLQIVDYDDNEWFMYCPLCDEEMVVSRKDYEKEETE